jgi:hypothetical protein
MCFRLVTIMSVNYNQCIPLLKRQNAISVPKVEIDFANEEGEKELCAFLDRILMEQELRENEFKRITELKENIKKYKYK